MRPHHSVSYSSLFTFLDPCSKHLSIQFIQGTLSLALPSLTINGFDASPTILAPPQPVDPSTIDPDDPNYEPYDPRLAIKLRELYAELEAETTRSAELRREAPSAAAQSYVEKLRGEMASQDKQWDAARRSILEDAEGGLERWELPRSPEVRATFEKTQKEMESLKGVTEAVARLERAKRAALEVEGS